MAAFAATELAAWSRGTWTPREPASIEGVSHDTRTLARGNLYVALEGERFDGHDFLPSAAAKGASGAVVARDRRLPPMQDLPFLEVANPAEALRDMARGYRRVLGLKIVGVTGSAGKSTVKELTAHVLTAHAPTARTRGNWNNDVGLPLSLLGMDRSVRLGVFEVGTNHPGEIAHLCDTLQPTWGIVTNVGAVHIEFFDSLEAIAREKACLLKSLPPDGVSFLNRDSSCFDVLRSAAPGRVVTVSTSGPADYTGALRQAAAREVVIFETATNETLVFRSPLPGLHNVANVLAAVAVARAHGMDWSAIRERLENHTPLPMRWEESTVAGIRVINDAYNANPLSMQAAIRALEDEATTGSGWLVLGAMLELGRLEKEEHLRLGRFVAAGAWAGLITVGPLGDDIARGAEEAGMDKERVTRCRTAAEAAAAVSSLVRAGDAVLLKASRGVRLDQVVEALRKLKGG